MVELSEEEVKALKELAASLKKADADPSEASTEVKEREAGKSAVVKSHSIMTERMLDGARAEIVGLLGAFPKWGVAVKEEVLARDNAQAMILKGSSMFPRRIPWAMVTIVAMGISVIAMFTVNPELLQGLGLFVSANQFVVVFVALIALVGLYLWVRRRRK